MLLTYNSSFYFVSHLQATDQILYQGTGRLQLCTAQNLINHISTLISQPWVVCTDVVSSAAI